MIYIYIGLILAFLALFEVFFRQAQNSKLSFIVAILILFFLSSLRLDVGTDWDAYLAFYTGNGPVEKLEYGYRKLNNLLSHYGLSFQLFLAVISAITLFFIYKAGSLVKYKIIFLLIYFSDLFLYYNLSGIRQGIAIAITLYSTKYIVHKKFLIFMFFVILASTFHLSAFIYLIAYLAYNARINSSKVLLYSIFIAVISLYIDNIIENLLSFIKNGNLRYYLSIAKTSDDNITNFIIGLIKRSIVLIVFLILPGKEKYHNKQLIGFIKVYIIGFTMYSLFYTINEDVGIRLSSYFLILDTFIFSTYFQIKTKKEYKVFIYLTVFCMCMYKLYTYSQLPEYAYKVFL